MIPSLLLCETRFRAGAQARRQPEVTGAVLGDADGAAVTGQDWGYFYDAIGNRSSNTRAGRAVIYEPNALNQYDLLHQPGEVEISGLTAPGVARVEVNGQPAVGRPAGNGEPEGFTQWLTVANIARSVWLDVGVKATRPGEPPENTPLEMLRQGRLWVPKAQTAPEHDENGNLLFDGRWRYAWDGENRLVSMETDSEVGLLPNAPPRLRLELVYDGGSRRVGKVVKRWQTGAEQWVTIASWKYLYEGWNLIAELDGLRGDALERGYVWGLDLSGTFQGAGGVCGLLGVYDDRRGKVYPVMTEVNGNVMGLVDAASGQWVARYDYDAFGNRITAAGPLAGLCPVGFSTKYTDAETGLCYYGYRYYIPPLGRWTSRDPIEEAGGLNLYGMVGNDALNTVDLLGQVSVDLKFGAFIPTSKGFPVIASPVTGVNWLPEPDPFFSLWWCSTDNRNRAGDPGTSKISAKLRKAIKPSEIGKLKPRESTLFDVTSHASHRIKIVYVGSSFPLSQKYRGRPGDHETRTAAPSLKVKVEDDPGGCSSKVTLTGAAGYPFKPLGFIPVPSIDFEVTWTLTKIGVGADSEPISVSIEGKHDNFPAYEAIVNRTVFYEWYPSDPGPSLMNLGTSRPLPLRSASFIR